MKIAVIHPTLNSAGGSEQVCIDILASLRDAGHKVVLGTFENTNWDIVEKYFGKVSKPQFEIIDPRRFGINAYGEFLNFRYLSSKMPQDSEAFVVSCNSPWFYPPKAKVLIMYLLPYIGYRQGLWRFYLEPYRSLQCKLLDRCRNKLLLTNSNFSAGLVNDAYSVNARVLFPPVNIKRFFASNKEDLVVTIGRFDPKKRHELLIEAFRGIKPNVRCSIIGGVTRDFAVQSRAYLARLRKMIIEYGLSDRIELKVNCKFDELVKTLSKAKIYVHCCDNEQFGISIVESMAAGCVPVVHRSGGAYYDILDHDEYGFSFGTVDELREKINLIIEKSWLFTAYKRKAIQRAGIFSEQVFKARFIDLVKSVTESN